MKKITLAAICLLAITCTSLAQTHRGDWMVGGNLSISTTSGNSEFNLMPSAGYFFANGLVIGGQLIVDFGKSGDLTNTAFGIGPFLRYYFDLKNTEMVKPLLATSFDVATQTTKFNGEKTSNTLTSFFIGGGCAFFINHNVAIDAIAGYNRSKVENTPSEGGFQMTVGFQVQLLGSEVKRK
jgi:hypothetical protein